MIHVSKVSSPTDFDDLVAIPGREALLELVGHPSAPARPGPKRKVVAQNIRQIPSNKIPAYWTKVLPQLCTAYKRICSYLGLRIYPGTAVAEVDHFKPKAKYQHLSYDWDNFRLSCKLANTFKGDNEDVIDPFEIEADCFGVNLLSGHVITLCEDAALRQRVDQTIDRLHLNSHPTFVEARLTYIEDYLNGDISYQLLQRDAPFVAREIERQGKKL